MTISPFMSDLLFLLLTFWPCLKVVRRLGLSARYCAVLPLSLLLPALGHVILAVLLAIKPWPAFPASPVKPKRERLV